MIRKLTVAMPLFFLLISGCGQESKTPLAGEVSTGGYIQEIEALGYHFSGEPSKQWRLYETVTFDSAGHEISRVSHWAGKGTTIRTEYDDQGRKIAAFREAQDQLGKVDYKLTWSEDGLMCVEEEYVHNEGRVLGRTTTKKDSSGKLLQVITENLQFPASGIDTVMQTFHYDLAGRLILEEDYHLGKTIPSVRYIRDSSGLAVKLERYDSEGMVSRTEFFAYDERGNVTREWAKESLDQEKKLVRSRKWNDAGLVIEEHEYSGDCTEAGEASGKCRIYQSIRYTYDEQGRPLTKDTFKEGNASPSMQLRYSYKPLNR